VVVADRVEIYPLNDFTEPDAVIPIKSVISVGWISNDQLAAVDSTGVLRAFSIAGTALWNDIKVAALFGARIATVGQTNETAEAKWWLSVGPGRLMLVGDGQSVIAIDTHLGAQIMGPMEWRKERRLFDRPTVSQGPNGELELLWYDERYQRAGVSTEEDISMRTGIRDGVLVKSISSLLK
jgi:hypothetical protein